MKYRFDKYEIIDYLVSIFLIGSILATLFLLFVLLNNRPVHREFYEVIIGDVTVKCEALRGSYLTNCCANNAPFSNIINPSNVFTIDKQFTPCSK